MEIYNKDGSDKTVIMGVREALYQAFSAPGWLDLRIGFLLSITDKTADDTTDDAEMEETISASPSLSIWDRYYIGVINQQGVPGAGQTFIGFTNRGQGRGNNTLGDSVLSKGDAGVGTDNDDYWWPHNSLVDSWSGQIIDNGETRVQSHDGVEQHFIRTPANVSNNYATLLMLRLRRSDLGDRSKVITVTLKQGTKSGDVLFTADPTKTLLQENMEGYPSVVQQWGPTEVANVPDSLFVYWPWHNSRIRIHCMGIEKIAT